MNGIFDTNNTLITKRVDRAISRPDVIEIENRTLDGKFHLQTLGSGATVLDVAAYVTFAQKAILDARKRTATPIRVVFDGRFYVGLIRGIPEYERIIKDRFPVAFTLLVTQEGAV